MSDELLRTIARETAEAAFTLIHWADGTSLGAFNGGGITRPMLRDGAEDWLANRRAEMADNYVLAACERALRQSPPPGGMSDERLAGLMPRLDDAPGRYWSNDVVREILDEVLLCRRLLADADVPAALLREAYAAGARAQKAACEAALEREAAYCYRALVAATALVTPGGAV